MNRKKAAYAILSGLIACVFAIVGVRYFVTGSLPFQSTNIESATSVPDSLIKEKQIVQYGFPKFNRDAGYIGFGDLDALEKHSDIIAVGTPVLPFEERENTTSRYEDGVMQDFATLTEFAVETVLKDPGEVVQNGQVSFYEPIAFANNMQGSKALFSIANYRELQYGERYIVFLSDNGQGGYSVINMSNGTFNMNKTDRTSGDPTHHKLMTQIFGKYDLE